MTVAGTTAASVSGGVRVGVNGCAPVGYPVLPQRRCLDESRRSNCTRMKKMEARIEEDRTEITVLSDPVFHPAFPPCHPCAIASALRLRLAHLLDLLPQL